MIFILNQTSYYIVDWDLFFKITPIVSPFLVGYIAYKYGVKSKKTEIIFQQKIVAFQQLNEVLADFKQYALAVVAESSGNEFALHPKEGESSLTHRQKLYKVVSKCEIFLDQKSRKKIEDLIGDLSVLNNAELYIAQEINTDIDWISRYETFAERVDEVIEILFKQLN